MKPKKLTRTGDDPALAAARRPITEYGCVRCQRYHAEGLDPLYQDHLFHQSKHGTRTRPPTAGEVFRRLVENG